MMIDKQKKLVKNLTKSSKKYFHTRVSFYGLCCNVLSTSLIYQIDFTHLYQVPMKTRTRTCVVFNAPKRVIKQSTSGFTSEVCMIIGCRTCNQSPKISSVLTSWLRPLNRLKKVNSGWLTILQSLSLVENCGGFNLPWLKPSIA